MGQKKIELKGIVERVVRVNGKLEAQVVVSIPIALSADIPLGRVIITIDPLQKAMFGQPVEGDVPESKPEKPRKSGK